MHPLGRFIVITIATLAVGSEAKAEDCKKSIAGLDAYERELKQAIRDEPEDLPKELRRYAKALASGDPAQADRIQRRTRRGLVGLNMIDPPPDLARLHDGMIAYYRAGVAVLDPGVQPVSIKLDLVDPVVARRGGPGERGQLRFELRGQVPSSRRCHRRPGVRPSCGPCAPSRISSPASSPERRPPPIPPLLHEPCRLAPRSA